MKKSKTPHLFLHFLLEGLGLEDSNIEKTLTLSDIREEFLKYVEKCRGGDIAGSNLHAEDSEMEIEAIKTLLEGAFGAKPVESAGEGQEDGLTAYRLSKGMIRADWIDVNYDVRRIVEKLLWMHRRNLSGILIGPPASCKSSFAKFYAAISTRLDYGRKPIYLQLIPGSTPAQLYSQLLSKLCEDGLPVERDDEYSPTVSNLWNLRQDVHDLIDKRLPYQILIDNACQQPYATLRELEDLADRFKCSIVCIGRNSLRQKLEFSTLNHWQLTARTLFFPGMNYTQMQAAVSRLVPQANPGYNSDDSKRRFIDQILASSPEPTDDKASPSLTNTKNFDKWKEALFDRQQKAKASRSTTNEQLIPAN
jgi:hypothetical protein